MCCKYVGSAGLKCHMIGAELKLLLVHWAKAFQNLKTLLPKILLCIAIHQKCKKPNPPMGKDWAKVLLLWSNAERVHYSLWKQNRCDSKVESPCSSEPKV